MQHTSHLLMIKPVNFSFNAETAVNNSFQTLSSESGIQEKARQEFEYFIETLKANDIDVTVVEDTPVPYTPDSVFPNNWISFHEDGSICLYPMFAQNRRMERKPTVLTAIAEKFRIDQTHDFTNNETSNLFLEGTGSMVLDRENKIAYACLSPRTHITVLEAFCNKMNYQPVAFTSVDVAGNPIYHTNVMMCVADDYVIICLESIADMNEKEMVIKKIHDTHKIIIEISFDQMNRFSGNMLQVHNTSGQKFLVMSSQAYHALNNDQIKEIEKFNPIIHSDIKTIETNGGGSARCMMAEVFLPLK
ncbi:citrulline utilization hydrolase CtlX [Sediminibacterium salmoneum]|uniref:citrulline utilization hydrolase CtlX n=1 Tax=Sediminibacterium salmoneum TaxID=426421 RepID=UPI00047B1540|nr:arginine deiminase-related protein [Sediminibacterium salmoneum]